MRSAEIDSIVIPWPFIKSDIASFAPISRKSQIGGASIKPRFEGDTSKATWDVGKVWIYNRKRARWRSRINRGRILKAVHTEFPSRTYKEDPENPRGIASSFRFIGIYREEDEDWRPGLDSDASTLSLTLCNSPGLAWDDKSSWRH